MLYNKDNWNAESNALEIGMKNNVYTDLRTSPLLVILILAPSPLRLLYRGTMLDKFCPHLLVRINYLSVIAIVAALPNEAVYQTVWLPGRLIPKNTEDSPIPHVSKCATIIVTMNLCSWAWDLFLSGLEGGGSKTNNVCQ